MNFEIAPKSTEDELNWYDANRYCITLGEGWRLPTKEELNQIYQSENNFEKDWYWSSTEYNGDLVWLQNFDDGDSDDYYKSGPAYIRAVRDLKDKE